MHPDEVHEECVVQFPCLGDDSTSRKITSSRCTFLGNPPIRNVAIVGERNDEDHTVPSVMKLAEKLTDEEVDEMIPETDVDDTQCSEQIVDVPVPQIADRIVEVGTAFHKSESQNESLCRSSTCHDTHTHTPSGGEDRQKLSISRSQLRTHRMGRLSQDTIQQRTGEQLVNKHVQQVVNSVDVRLSEIVKKTVQRKNPIIHEKINHVSKQ